MNTSYVILIIFLVINQFLTEDLCSKTVPTALATCSSQDAPYCCNDGTSQVCDPSDASNAACNAGFYQRGNKTLPCPKGYYCLQNYKCMIPCDIGMLCVGYDLVKNTTSCRSTSTGITLEAVNFGGVLTCPGDIYELYCSPDYYCPDPITMLPCPDGKICTGSTGYAVRCNLFGECTPFAGGNIDDGIGLLLLGVMVVVIIIVMLVKYKLEGKSILVGYSAQKLDVPKNKNNFRMSFNLPNGLWTFSHVDIEGQRHNLPHVKHSLSVCVRDFTFTLKDGHRVLQNVNANFRHSQLNIVMGPSGCGKSTLINSLMGATDQFGTVDGHILVNGVEFKSLRQIKRYVGYVMQQDLMHENLTVKEILTYQAQLRLPKSEDNKYITSSVQEVINLLSLSRIGDRVVGQAEDNLISGGQRKRISIGMELVANPSIMILDEPTSGLDSATSLMIVQLLKSLSRQTNINIMCVIHQPRVELFKVFDTATLLSSHGRLMYNGEAALMPAYFKYLGFKFAFDANPADVMIDIVCGFVVSDKYSVRQLHNCWKKKKEEEMKEQTSDNVDGNENPKELLEDDSDRRNLLHQTWILLHREFVCLLRSFTYNVKEVCIILVLGLLFSYLFRKQDFYVQKTRYAMDSLFIGFIAGVNSSLRVFGADMQIFFRERNTNPLCYFIAKCTVHIPVIFFFIPISFLGVYWTAGAFYASYEKVYQAYALAVFAVSGIAYVLSIQFSQKVANLVCTAFIIIFSLTSGTIITICELDEISVVGPILYMTSYAKWFVQARIISETEQFSGIYNKARMGYLWKNNYTQDEEAAGLWGLFTIGVITRLIALLLLIYQNSNFHLSRALSCIFWKWKKELKERRVLDSHVSVMECVPALNTQTNGNGHLQVTPLPGVEVVDTIVA